MESMQSDEGTSFIKILRFLKLLRLIRYGWEIFRLVRIFKLKKVFGVIQDFIENNFMLKSFLRFLKLTCQIVFLAHWQSCIFNYVVNFEQERVTFFNFDFFILNF